MSRVSIFLHTLAVSLGIYHTRSKIVTTGILRQLPGMQVACQVDNRAY